MCCRALWVPSRGTLSKSAKYKAKRAAWFEWRAAVDRKGDLQLLAKLRAMGLPNEAVPQTHRKDRPASNRAI